MEIELVNTVHIAYIAISLLGISLVVGKSRYSALVLLLLAHTVQESFNIFEELGISPEYLLITPAIQLAFGPLYFLFVKNILYGEIHLKKEWIHLIPLIIGLFLGKWWPAVLAIAFVILVIYLVATYKILKSYERSMANWTSADEQYAFRWLLQTFILIGTIEFVDFIRLNLQLLLNEAILVNWYFISACLSFLCTFYLLVRAIRQPELFSRLGEIESVEAKQQKLSEREIEQAEALNLFSLIDEHIEKTQSFKQPKYSLRDLSDQLGLSEQMVSWAINQGGELSFSTYINGKRLDAFLLIMTANGANFNILQNAFDVGFGSKSTFNMVFKQRTGKTPTQYLKTL